MKPKTNNEKKSVRKIVFSHTNDFELSKLMNNFSLAKNENELSYQDPNVTVQQKKRDNEVTKLLKIYVSSYENKVKHSTVCRCLILGSCLLIVIAFAIVLGIITWRILANQGEAELPVTDLTAFITACISFITLIIGLLTIITKYFFPENDEQYITKIVESIQKNDLENKRENAKYQHVGEIHSVENTDSNKSDKP